MHTAASAGYLLPNTKEKLSHVFVKMDMVKLKSHTTNMEGEI